MATHPRKIAIANTFGALGYISIIFQWLWSFIVIANPLLSSDLRFLIPANSTPTPPVSNTPPSPLAVGIVILLTIFVFAFTLYVLWKLPKAIGIRAGRATKHAAEALTPLITHRHPTTTKRERRKLSQQLVLAIKLVCILAPALALLWAKPIGELTYELILVVGLFCAACSLFYFGVQQLCVYIWKLPFDRTW